MYNILKEKESILIRNLRHFPTNFLLEFDFVATQKHACLILDESSFVLVGELLHQKTWDITKVFQFSFVRNTHFDLWEMVMKLQL